MAGPIIRQGIISLGIELAAPKLSAGPIATAIASQQKAAAAATRGAAGAADAFSESLAMQARAEEKVEALQEQAIETSKIVAQEKRTEAKLAKELATMVEMEANAKLISGHASEEAAAKAEALAAANAKIAQSYQKAALGTLQMVRGVALLAGSENDSLAVVIKHVFFIQGLIDVSKGATVVTKALADAHKAQAAAAAAAGVSTTRAAIATQAFNTAASSGPLIILVGVLYTAIKVYEHFANAEERALAMAEKQRETYRQLAEAQAARNELTAIGAKADFARVEALSSLIDKEAALRKILSERGEADKTADADAKYSKLFNTPAEVRVETLGEAIGLYERQQKAAEQLRDVEKQQADEAKKANSDKIEAVKLAEREYEAARKTAKSEEDKARALRASIGLFDKGEQRRLDRAVTAAEGGHASRKDLLTIQRSGGEAGQRLVEHFAAPMGKAIADHIERATAKITGENPRQKAQNELQQSLAARNKETGGKTSETVIAELQAQNDAVTNEATRFAENISSLLTGIANRLESLETEQSRQRQAARNAQHSGRGK